MNLAHPLSSHRSSHRRFDHLADGDRHERLEAISRIATGAFLGAFAAFILAIVAFGVFEAAHRGQVYPGLSVGDQDLGGMSRAEVRSAIATDLEAYAARPVVLVANGEPYELAMRDLGMTFDLDATAERLYNAGRTGSWWDRSIFWTRTMISGTRVEPSVTFDVARFRAGLASISPEIVSDPRNAYVQMQTGREPRLVEDVPGVSIDLNDTRASIRERVDSLDPGKVNVTLISEPADVRAADIEHGLPTAQRAVGSEVVARTAEGEWGLTPSDLRGLVSVDDAGALQVREDGVKAFVEDLADEVDRPSEDAGITVDGNGAFVVIPAVDSARVDVEKTTVDLVAALKSGETAVDITVVREKPAILDAAATDWAARADTLAGDGFTLTWEGGKAQFGRGDVIAAMVIDPRPDEADQFALSFDENVVAERLAPVIQELAVEPRDARLRLIDGGIRAEAEAVAGREVDVAASTKSIMNAFGTDQPSVGLTITTIEPAYKSDAVASIQLPDVLGQSQTFYGTSSDPRRKNVERAVAIENGWLVPPDGVFSYASIMGLVDEANGFVTGFGIVADPAGGVTTAPVIGGGICQVSTTIFQAAFWSGLPILERYAHPYWLQSYGQAPYGMQGLDAMVNIEPDWSLDLKFQNTTGNWIVVVMTADGQNVRAEIRGTNPGWTIDPPQPVITDVVSPGSEMTYTDSPELPKGQELQVETAQEGFTATITRIVKDGTGAVIDEYVLESTYAASRNLTLRGTGG